MKIAALFLLCEFLPFILLCAILARQRTERGWSQMNKLVMGIIVFGVFGGWALVLGRSRGRKCSCRSHELPNGSYYCSLCDIEWD